MYTAIYIEYLKKENQKQKKEKKEDDVNDDDDDCVMTIIIRDYYISKMYNNGLSSKAQEFPTLLPILD